MAFLTRAELIASFAPNSTQDISAVDHQNYVESVMVYGDLTMPENLAFDVTTTPRKFEFSQNQFAYGMTPDTTNWEFDNVEEGHYLMLLDVDMTLSGVDTTYSITMFVDGAPAGAGYNYNTRDDSLRLSRSFVIPAVVTGNAGTIDVRINSSSAQTIAIYGVTWVMLRMGSD